MSLAAVSSARVHLALPSQNGFLREHHKPSASVLLQLHAGRLLDRSQVAECMIDKGANGLAMRLGEHLRQVADVGAASYGSAAVIGLEFADDDL